MYSSSNDREDYHAGKAGHNVSSEAGQHGLREHRNENHGRDIGPSSCFTADTKILTPYGYRCIIDITPGELVLSYDTSTQLMVSTRVLKNVKFGKRSIWTIKFKDLPTKIKTTKHHPFLTTKGWVKASKLTNQNRLLQFRDDEIVEVQVAESICTSSNLEVFNLYTSPIKNYCPYGFIAHNYNVAYRLREKLAGIFSKSEHIDHEKIIDSH